MKAVCDNESGKRKRYRDDPAYSIMRSEDGSMSFQASRRRAERGRGSKSVSSSFHHSIVHRCSPVYLYNFGLESVDSLYAYMPRLLTTSVFDQ